MRKKGFAARKSPPTAEKGVNKMRTRAIRHTARLMKIQSVNPYTEEVMKEYPLLRQRELDMIIESSRTAFNAWRDTSIAERAGLVKRLGEHLRTEKRRYAELITKEMGKPIKDSLAEIEKCAWLCDYYADNAERFLAPENVQTEAKRSYVAFEPLGVVLAIMPWNFPFWQAFRFGVPAVAAGNVVLLKHASNVPTTAIAIEEAFRSAGFPENVMKTVLIDPEMALRLVDEDKVDAVSLTGSNKAGEQVGAAAGGRIKPFVLELGGSDAFIVLDDADIEKAARTAARARMINTGQSCIAAKRFIVMESVAEEFKKHFIEQLKELKIGDPMDETTDIGPVAKREILNTLREQLRDAQAKGGQVIRLEYASKKGYFFPPAVVLNPKPGMKIMTEEVFGPIAPIITVKDEDEAVRVANDTEYGLGAAIWSRDTERAERLAKRIEAGFIAVNDMVRSDPRLPFGGVKKSGIGRELSHYGLKEFVNIKSVVVK